jgi:hypothetical protein
VAEIDGDADGDLFGASKVSSEKKKEMWVNQLPTDGSLEPEVEQSFFFGSAQFCFSIFGYWVVGSTQQNLHR